jgi:hypothetical protein
MLWGCTEMRKGTDCYEPPQKVKAEASGIRSSDVDFQTPVEVTSNEIEANSPVLPDVGPLKLGFEVSIAGAPQAAEVRKMYGAACATDPGASVECTVFHYAIRNLGDRPIRNGRYSCSDFSIIPEYRAGGNEWKALRSQLMECSMNVYFETPIEPGKAFEADFILSKLAPCFDTSPLYPAGSYELRFGFHPNACLASSDGSFCVQFFKDQTVTVSNVFTINATRFVPGASTAP